MLSHTAAFYILSDSHCRLSTHMKLFSDTELKNPLYNLIAHPKDKTDVIGNAPRAFQIICMTLTDGQAHGLCFSVKKGVETPPSLVNIYKELEDDMGYRN